MDYYGTFGDSLVTTSDDFLRCPHCGTTRVQLDTVSPRNGLVLNTSGVVADVNCLECDSKMTLALFNSDINGEILARINWVKKPSEVYGE